MNLDQMMRADVGPRLARIDDVPALTAINADQREHMWGQLGLVPSLAIVSRLFADLDLAATSNTDDDVVKAFLAGVTGPARAQATAQLRRGNVVLHPIVLLLTIKEIIEYCDVDGDVSVADDELLAVFLSLAAEANEEAMPTVGASFDEVLAETTVNRVSQAGLAVTDSLELLATSTAGTWHRAWSSRTESKILSDLAEGPAEQWESITGVELDDFLSLGWLFYNLWRHEGFAAIDTEFFTQNGVPAEAVDFLVQHCSLPLSEMRSLLQRERSQDAAMWARYKLQQYPLLRLDDGTLLPVRFQFVIQRIFGDHLFLESHDMLRTENAKAADHFASAMRDIFEERVGDVLDRIRGYDQTATTVLVEESAMRRAWRSSKGKLPKICDFALFKQNTAVLVDANMRNLPQPFAERSGSFEALQGEIDSRFTTTKFKQLLSTIELFMKHGWNRSGVSVTRRTQFVPLVVVPDAGMPSELAVENTVFVRSLPLVKQYNDDLNFYRVHVPAILCWRDLLMLDGLAEQGQDVFTVLKRWRNIDPLGRYGREPLPLPLREFLEQRYPGSVLSRYEHRQGWDLFERLRTHSAERMIDAAPEAERDELRHVMQVELDALPTWETRGDWSADGSRQTAD